MDMKMSNVLNPLPKLTKYLTATAETDTLNSVCVYLISETRTLQDYGAYYTFHFQPD